jgi:hypothetical protein
MKQTLAEKKARHRRAQVVYDAIAALRRGETVALWGRAFRPVDWATFYGVVEAHGFRVTCLYKYRNRVRATDLFFKDAWPNGTICDAKPSLFAVPGGYPSPPDDTSVCKFLRKWRRTHIRAKHIYGYVAAATAAT